MRATRSQAWSSSCSRTTRRSGRGQQRTEPGPARLEDTAVAGKTCTTNALGTAPSLTWFGQVLGRRDGRSPGLHAGADQYANVGPGRTVGELTFVNPRKHVVIVLVATGGRTPSSERRDRRDLRRRRCPARASRLKSRQRCALGGARGPGARQQEPDGRRRLGRTQAVDP